MSAGGDFGNPLRKFKLVFLGEQSGECAAPPLLAAGLGFPAPPPVQPFWPLRLPAGLALPSSPPQPFTGVPWLLLARIFRACSLDLRPSSGLRRPHPGPLGPLCPQPSPHPASCPSLSSSALHGLLHPGRLSGAPPLFLALFPVPIGTGSEVSLREAPNSGERAPLQPWMKAGGIWALFSPEAWLGVVQVSRKVLSGGHREKQFLISFHLYEELVRVSELIYFN